MRLSAFLIWLIAAASAPAFAQSDEEAARIAWTLERGRLLFELDRAAWVGTDDMLEQMRDAAASDMRGYIVERDGDGFIVTFYGGSPQAPLAYYRGVVRDRRVVSRDVFPAASRPSLTAMQARLAATRDMARGLGRNACDNRSFNTAAIPPETPDGPIDLYLLTPQVRPDQFPLGGHYRFTIAADGSVSAERAFTNTCIEIGPQPGTERETTAALFITHLLDPIPTEIHVFTAMTSGVPVGVGIGSPVRIWWVTREGIRLLEETDEPPQT